MREKKRKPVDFKKYLFKLNRRFEQLSAIKHCPVCKTPAIDASHGYCHACGNKLLKQKGPIKMLYKAIRVSENGKAVTCPHCENEELTRGDFCMICGSNIVNRCADTQDAVMPHNINKGCNAILSGNARYCSICGNESVFFQKGWLRDWRSENVKRAIENINMTSDNITDFTQKRKQG